MSHRRYRYFTLALSAALLVSPFAVTPTAAQSGIIGSWATSDGEIISVAPCGEALCATVTSGRYKGAAVARVSGPGPEYKGRVHDPRNGKSYPGSLTLNGGRVALSGCIMEIFCKTVQHWQRAG
ncbi:DUF2147 domain-containing protein [Fulvimarina sp. MAC3]|uniref:DUF2147 domain-containing protein n=1 Tax=Fulvimarina sp. MAC3 TaxID=3148887 RepID=UPI0031FC03D2